MFTSRSSALKCSASSLATRTHVQAGVLKSVGHTMSLTGSMKSPRGGNYKTSHSSDQHSSLGNLHSAPALGSKHLAIGTADSTARQIRTNESASVHTFLRLYDDGFARSSGTSP